MRAVAMSTSIDTRIPTPSANKQPRRQNRRMHLALLTTSFPDSEDGSEAAGSFVADFAASLAKHVRVTVIAAGRQQSREVRDGYCLQRFSCLRLPLSLLSPRKLGDWHAIVQTLRAGWRALEHAHQETAFDHVLALWALPSGAWARRLQRRYGVPYSTWALGSDIWGLGRQPILRSILRSTLRNARFRYADGVELVREVEQIAGKPCNFMASCRYLPRKRTQATACAPPYRVAFLGRWHPNKGADLLIEALQQLGDDDWKNIYEFRFHGGGPLAPQVEAGFRTLAARGCPVRLGGYLDREQAAELLAWADWLVIPSRIESIPVIYSDALQSGCRMLSTPVGDLTQLVPAAAGVLCAEASAAALVATISASMSRSMPSASPMPELLARFDPMTAANAFIDRLQNLIDPVA